MDISLSVVFWSSSKAYTKVLREPRSMQPTSSGIRVDRVGHFVYEVSDIERTTRFWTELLGFRVSDRNEFGIVFLQCENSEHHQVGIVQTKHPSIPPPDAGLKIQHVAFHVPGVQFLFNARETFRKHGVPIVFEGRRGAGASIEITFEDPDGYVFELFCDLDEIGPDGRARPPEQWRRASSLEDALANPLPATW